MVTDMETGRSAVTEAGLDRSPARAASVLRAFIVEDSPIILVNLTAALEEIDPARVRVIGHAEDEDTAVRRLQQLGSEVDLIIIDIFLKKGSGLAVLVAAARADFPARRIVVTNYATPDIRKRCLAMGAHQVFDKSVDLDALLDYCAGRVRQS